MTRSQGQFYPPTTPPLSTSSFDMFSPYATFTQACTLPLINGLTQSVPDLNPHARPFTSQLPPHQNHTQLPSQFLSAPYPNHPWSYQQDTIHPRPLLQPHYKYPKMDFPKFDGKDARSWVKKTDKFFKLNPFMDPRSKVH